MKKIKNSLKAYLVFFIILTISTLIYAFLIYKKVIATTDSLFHTTTFIVGIIAFFILGLFCGIKAKKNGLVEGMVASLIVILIVLLINLFMDVRLNTSIFVKGLTYILASSLGGVIGVNVVTKDN